MCGIFGIIFHERVALDHRASIQTLFNTMAVLSADRGTDATGMAQVWVNGQGYMYKDAVASYDIIRRDEWNNYALPEAWYDMVALMGHTRKATHGEKTLARNAHPFRFSEGGSVLFGTHNGVINNHRNFAPKTGAFDVDSQNLFYALSTKLTEGGIQSELYQVSGSYALAFARDGVMYLARNSGSPCVRIRCKELPVTLYASTEHTLRCALAMANLTGDEPRLVAPGYLYKWLPYGEESSTLYDTYAAQTRYYGGCDSWDGTDYTTRTQSKTAITTPNTSVEIVGRNGSRYSIGMASDKLSATQWCAGCRGFSYFTNIDQMFGYQSLCDTCKKQRETPHTEQARGVAH